MNTLHKLLISLLLTIFTIVNFATLAWAQNGAGKVVTSVEVQLDISGKIYQGLQERIEYSVNRVGEKLLISQPVSLLEQNKSKVRQTILNVFSKVLVGFQTETVDLFLGEHTKILIQIKPLPPLITNLDVDIKLKGVAEEIVALTAGAAAKVSAELKQIFEGLPVAAISWADNIFDLVINYLVEREYPGFTPGFTIKPGENCQVMLELSPKEPLVAEVNTRYSSTGLPIWLVRIKTKTHQSQINLLKGLPVEFLTHYQPQIEQYLTDYLKDCNEISLAGFVPTVKIIPGMTTTATIGMSSLYFQMKLEARYFRGENDSFVNLQGYLGHKINDSELFARVYTGENPDGLYKVGFRTQISHNFYGGFEYEFEHNYKNLLFSYEFDRGDYLEFNLGLEGSINKALIGFYINENINIEIVNYDKKYGIQLMYHLW
ncbi:MAG TPA: hypothetical protein VIM29_02595 [Bacillota bacterium]